VARPWCYWDPYLPIESFQRRDEVSRELVALVQRSWTVASSNPAEGARKTATSFDILVSVKDEEGAPARLPD